MTGQFRDLCGFGWLDGASQTWVVTLQRTDEATHVDNGYCYRATLHRGDNAEVKVHEVTGAGDVVLHFVLGAVATGSHVKQHVASVTKLYAEWCNARPGRRP